VGGTGGPCRHRAFLHKAPELSPPHGGTNVAFLQGGGEKVDQLCMYDGVIVRGTVIAACSLPACIPGWLPGCTLRLACSHCSGVPDGVSVVDRSGDGWLPWERHMGRSQSKALSFCASTLGGMDGWLPWGRSSEAVWGRRRCWATIRV
jgi:hypothetical protein